MAKRGPGGPKHRSEQDRRERAAESRQRATRKHRQRVALITVGVIALVGLGALATVLAADGGGTGETDPTAFDLPALDGDTRIRLADHRGKPVVVNFFASWCTACDAELPGFAAVRRELEDQVTFIGVNSLETGDAHLMPRRHDIEWWPLARDIGVNESNLHDALGGRGMPITAFYDAEGRLVDFAGGALPESALRDKMAQLYGLQTSPS